MTDSFLNSGCPMAQCCLLLLHTSILNEFKCKLLSKIQHSSTFQLIKWDSAKKQFTSVMKRKKVKTLFGHLLVAHTTSRLIGECLFPLWSSPACLNMKWLWITSGYLKVVNFLISPSFQSCHVSLPLLQSFVPYVDMRDMT